jgi:hypothetical protein
MYVKDGKIGGKDVKDGKVGGQRFSTSKWTRVRLGRME